MIEINLVPDIKQELIKAQRTRSVVVTSSIFIGIASVGVVIFLALYVFTIQTVRSVLADTEIKKQSTALSKVEDLSKTLTIQNQLTKISDLNNSKKIDSRIFDLLKAVIPKEPNDVKISKLSIDPITNLVSMEGQAQGGYASLEIFKKTIEGAKFKYTESAGSSTTGSSELKEINLASDVTPSETSYGEDSDGQKVLRFSLSFKSATEVFSPSSKQVSFVISASGNVTDSYRGVPTSIFVTERAKDLKDGQ